MVGAGLAVPILELDIDLQSLLVILLGLSPLPLLLGYYAQIVVCSGLAVPIIELDFDLHSLLVILLGLSPLPLLLGYHTQLVVDTAHHNGFCSSIHGLSRQPFS